MRLQRQSFVHFKSKLIFYVSRYIKQVTKTLHPSGAPLTLRSCCPLSLPSPDERCGFEGPYLVSFPFVFSEVNDGVRQRGGACLHLLHHHLPGAVYCQDVAGEVLAGPPHCATGRAGNWTGGENEGQLN